MSDEEEKKAILADENLLQLEEAKKVRNLFLEMLLSGICNLYSFTHMCVYFFTFIHFRICMI